MIGNNHDCIWFDCFQGVDETYDAALVEFFQPYHMLVDLLVRVAVNHQNLTEQVINLSAMVAYEGVPLHLPYFAKLWYELSTRMLKLS